MIDQMSAFLQKLRKSTAGNTLAIAAAALVPLVGMVGGAVDISRYYMAVSRMQNACDAGALAARKQMESGEFEEADRDLGLRFFDQNYPDGTFGLENLDRDYVADADGTVTGTATGAMPTTIMQIFGKEGMDIAVSCSAEINISNTDIMFVLDVTGSMAWEPDGTSCWGECADSRMAGLRTAVVNFYDAVDGATSDAAQVRYGIVPYSSNVNVGASLPLEYIAASADYEARKPEEHLETWWETLSTTVDGYSNQGSVDYDQDVYWGWGKQNQEWHCQGRQPAAVPLGYVPDSLQEDTIEIVSETQDGNQRTRQITGRGMLRQVVPSYEYPGGKWCRTYRNVYESWADIEITVVDEWREEMVFDGWWYRERPLDTSNIKANGVGSAALWNTGTQGANESHTWGGCIEEANSVASATWDPIPANAFDLDINLTPANDNEAWKPFLPTATFRRFDGSTRTTADIWRTGDDSNWRMSSQGSSSWACPKAAVRLSEITRDWLVNYVSAANGFVPIGATYHDIGMIWGARFISPRGLFQADNEAAPNGDSIARHIVFMTDGELAPNPTSVYNSYGIEWWDRRVTDDGSTDAATTRHAARFQAACRQAREENISVWVVAFGTDLTQNLIDCATPGRAYSAASSEELNTAFQEIAQKIAALRLTS
jgi:Flp pilus assembly protein TadG